MKLISGDEISAEGATKIAEVLSKLLNLTTFNFDTV